MQVVFIKTTTNQSSLSIFIPLQAEGDSPFAATNALSRTIQGVSTGVGFIGAGLILQDSSRESTPPKVRGLTTGASVWIAAGIGYRGRGCHWVRIVADGFNGRSVDFGNAEWSQAFKSGFWISAKSRAEKCRRVVRFR